MIVVRIYFFAQQNYSLVTVISYVAFSDGINISFFFCSPKCRFEYKRSETPSRYYCYCGKVEDPPLDPWLVPHSCGQVCEREFKPPCGHKCLLLCHPGEFHIVCVVVFDWLFLLNVEAHRIIQAEF